MNEQYRTALARRIDHSIESAKAIELMAAEMQVSPADRPLLAAAMNLTVRTENGLRLFDHTVAPIAQLESIANKARLAEQLFAEIEPREPTEEATVQTCTRKIRVIAETFTQMAAELTHQAENAA